MFTHLFISYSSHLVMKHFLPIQPFCIYSQSIHLFDYYSFMYCLNLLTTWILLLYIIYFMSLILNRLCAVFPIRYFGFQVQSSTTSTIVFTENWNLLVKGDAMKDLTNKTNQNPLRFAVRELLTESIYIQCLVSFEKETGFWL